MPCCSYQKISKYQCSWLSALPIEEHGFALHKEMPFANNKTGNPHAYLATAHICGQPFAIDHALICPNGGYPTISDITN